MNKSNQYYNSILEENIKKRELLLKKINIISVMRLVIVLFMITVDYLLYKENNYILMILTTIIFLSIFVVTAFNHSSKLRDKKIAEILIDINQKGIDRINGEFKKFKDDGAEYLDYKHRFINDLNIFGANSLFQLVNSTVTTGGRNRLAQILSSEEISNKELILKKQEAIKELASKIKWRQEFIVNGLLNKSKKSNLNELLLWSEEESKVNILNIIISYIFIFVNAVSIFLATNEVLPWSFVILVFIIDFGVVKMFT